MVGLKHLICSLFVFAAWSPSGIDSNVDEPMVKPCDEIQVTEKLTHTTEGLSNGEIHLTFKDKEEQYTLFLFGDVVSKNRLDIKSDKILDLHSGNYTLLIQNKIGCKKQLKIKIK